MWSKRGKVNVYNAQRTVAQTLTPLLAPHSGSCHHIFMGMVKDYFAALFHDWVGKMSGLASVTLLFLPLIFPRLFVNSKNLERATWGAALVCAVIANYHVWVRQQKLITRLSKPDKCPVVRVMGWSEDHGQEEGTWGFWLYSEGTTPHEITLEEFEIAPSVTVASKMVPHMAGGQAFMPAWIKSWTSPSKWQLPDVFAEASNKRDGLMPNQMRPNYCCTLNIRYRDHNDCWYLTTQEIAFDPSDPTKRRTFTLGPIKHEKFGLNLPK
jgi:hypothetical protein